MASKKDDQGNGNDKFVPFKVVTFEDLDKVMEAAKIALHWEVIGRYEEDSYISICVGEVPEVFKIDTDSAGEASGFFQFFNLPTITYAEIIQRSVSRLLRLTREEVSAFRWMLWWCDTRTRDEAIIYKAAEDLDFFQWCRLWSLSLTLYIPAFRNYIETTRTIRADRMDVLPSHNVIRYLVDGGHANTDDILFNEYARNYADERNSLMDRRPDLFPKVFKQMVKYFRNEEWRDEGELAEVAKDPLNTTVTVEEIDIDEVEAPPGTTTTIHEVEEGEILESGLVTPTITVTTPNSLQQTPVD